MRIECDDRIERLLARHDDVALIDGQSGNGALVRKDQLLVTARDADAAHERVSRWVDRRQDDAAPGVAVLHLRPDSGVDVCDLAVGLSDGSAHKRVNAGPNHVVTAQPGWTPGPFGDPTPVDAISSPRSASPAENDVTVAILDTGIASHPWFDNQRWFAACGAEVRDLPDADHDARLDSVAGHGTFIAGIVLQRAPDAHLIISRIISGDGVTDELALLRGLAELRERAHRSGKSIDVVSLSLGCYTHDDKPSPVLERGINAFHRETVVVACAGNAGSDRPFWPAALKRVISVAALGPAGLDRASFSNFGWWVDACAPGDQVVSSFFNFDEQGQHGGERFTGYARWSGTSFAAPAVAGAIAALAATRGMSASGAAATLLDPSERPSMPDLGVFVDVGASEAAR